MNDVAHKRHRRRPRDQEPLHRDPRATPVGDEGREEGVARDLRAEVVARSIVIGAAGARGTGYLVRSCAIAPRAHAAALRKCMRAVHERRYDMAVGAMIKSVALRGENEAWRTWAQEQIARNPSGQNQ